MYEKKKTQFKINQKVFCPSHGVGVISDITEEEYSCNGMTLKLNIYKIFFVSSDIYFHVPFDKISEFGIRFLSSPETVKKVLAMLREPVKNIRGFSAKKIPEIQIKVDSGSLFLIAEAYKELYPGTITGSSYKEKTLQRSAAEKMLPEMSAVLNIDEKEITQTVHLAVAAAHGNKIDPIKLIEDSEEDFDDPEPLNDEDDDEEISIDRKKIYNKG